MVLSCEQTSAPCTLLSPHRAAPARPRRRQGSPRVPYAALQTSSEVASPSRGWAAPTQPLLAPERSNGVHVLGPEESPAHHAEEPFISIVDQWRRLGLEHGERLAVCDPHQSPPARLTFADLHHQITTFAAGLDALGLRPGDKVSLFSENSSRWLIADQAVMACGAADAVRGAASPAAELAYIARHSDSAALIVQDAATLEKLLPELTPPAHRTTGNGASGHGEASLSDTVRLLVVLWGKAHLADAVRLVVVLWGEPSAAARAALRCRALSFGEVLHAGTAREAPHAPPPLRPDTLATLVYTSGTTGSPKGVRLSHANLKYQVDNLGYYLPIAPGETSLSLLPPWHIYERACGYYILSCACTQTYTNTREFKQDLGLHPPHYFVCVPLVLDTLHNRVMATLRRAPAPKRLLAGALLAASARYVAARRVLRGLALPYARRARGLRALLGAAALCALLFPLHRLGGLLVYRKVRAALGIRSCVISGGGSLAAHLDAFFEALGLPVLNGWGLTETSPVLACRRTAEGQNVRGSVGLPIPGTQLRVVDPTTKEDLPDGEQGLLLARGPGVMQGYYGNEAATSAAFAAGNGWFDTGDLGWRAPSGIPGSRMAGHIVLTGRSKDTIVLSSGENIEPGPIEDACCVSPLIQHLVLLGQDQRQLGALIVPSQEAFDELAAAEGGAPLSDKERAARIRAELSRVLQGRPRRETVGAFALLPGPLGPEDGTLTRTMKPRRDAIFAKYSGEVAQVLQELERKQKR